MSSKILQILIILLMCQSYLSLGQNNKDKWQPFSKMPPINLYAELNSQLAQIENQDAIGLGFKGGVTWSPNSAVGFHLPVQLTNIQVQER